MHWCIFAIIATIKFCYKTQKTAKIQNKIQRMTKLNIFLNDEQTDQLLLMVDMLNDPSATAESFANELFSNLLAKTWRTLKKTDDKSVN